MLSGRVASVAAVITVAMCLTGSSRPIFPADFAPEARTDVIAVRGRVVCLDAVSTTTVFPESDPCNHPGARFELHARGGEIVRFVANDPRADVAPEGQ